MQRAGVSDRGTVVLDFFLTAPGGEWENALDTNAARRIAATQTSTLIKTLRLELAFR
jgi:hypothetical protein